VSRPEPDIRGEARVVLGSWTRDNKSSDWGVRAEGWRWSTW